MSQETLQGPSLSYAGWVDLINRFTGDVSIHTRDSDKKHTTPLIEVDGLPVPEDVQETFGEKVRLKAIDGADDVHLLVADTGPLHLRRHSLMIHRQAGRPEEDPPVLLLAVFQRKTRLTRIMPFVGSLAVPQPDVRLHQVVDPAEVTPYARLLDAAGEYATARDLNNPREIHIDHPRSFLLEG